MGIRPSVNHTPEPTSFRLFLAALGVENAAYLVLWDLCFSRFLLLLPRKSDVVAPCWLSNTADAFHKASTRNLWIDLAIQRSRDLHKYSFSR